MTVQGDSSARVVQAGKEGNNNKPEVSAQKEPFERTGAGYMRNLGLGGNKFSTHEVPSVDSKNGKGEDGRGTSKISGEENDGLKKSFGKSQQLRNDHQKLVKMGPKEYLKHTKFVIPRSIPTSKNTKCSRDCNAMSIKSSLGTEELEGTAQKDETQRLVEAAKEIANLIYKDYKGRPTHRPPINNHEPRN
ncbi:uncharacterized protein LOC113862556 [Abrus precatorius]|uniref:Uncharacterized protein LOC113862556 n=1 Tax=Abrus precatorius TaxID=3816 RepID=A0A8B8L5F2_ABRPR|nr:uncharacterized protein LOC113862556 [Abrus precatorius]